MCVCVWGARGMREGGHSPACSPGRALSAEGKASSGRERAPRKALNSADVIIEAGSASEQHCLGSWRARTAEAPVPGGVLEGDSLVLGLPGMGAGTEVTLPAS